VAFFFTENSLAFFFSTTKNNICDVPTEQKSTLKPLPKDTEGNATERSLQDDTQKGTLLFAGRRAG
jgi:hypothetical protein